MKIFVTSRLKERSNENEILSRNAGVLNVFVKSK